MALTDPELWCRLQATGIGPAEAALPFVDRLARDNGWRKGFAARVVEEYRRFLYLCCIAGRPVTPSDEVDQAWHLHLTYTRSYWEDLCRDVLGRPLHHGPTRGGPEERRKYDQQYRDTLELYEAQFGEAPPEDVWPEPAIRFGRRYIRVDGDAFWMVDKARLVRPVKLASAGGVMALGLAACSQIVDDLGAMSVFEKALVVAILTVFVIALVRSLNMSHGERKKRGSDGGGCGSGCGECGCGGGCD